MAEHVKPRKPAQARNYGDHREGTWFSDADPRAMGRVLNQELGAAWRIMSEARKRSHFGDALDQWYAEQARFFRARVQILCRIRKAGRLGA